MEISSVHHLIQLPPCTSKASLKKREVLFSHTVLDPGQELSLHPGGWLLRPEFGDIWNSLCRKCRGPAIYSHGIPGNPRADTSLCPLAKLVGHFSNRMRSRKSPCFSLPTMSCGSATALQMVHVVAQLALSTLLPRYVLSCKLLSPPISPPCISQ